MLMTVPERHTSPEDHGSQALIVGSTPKMQPVIFHLQNPQLPAPIAPASTALTHLNKAVAEQFNKAAPYLAVCAFAAQYAATHFSRGQQLHVSPQILARLTPNEKRLYAILQENEQMKKEWKNMGWQALFSLAMLHPKFNESYEFLQNTNDVHIAKNLLDPHVRVAASRHLQGRFIAKANSFVSAQLSKLLLLAYRYLNPPIPHPTIAKTVIDIAAATSIYIASPIIVNRCTRPDGLVAIMAREKALTAYNYLPDILKYRLIALKNWFKGYS